MSDKLIQVLFYALAVGVHGVPALAAFSPSRMARLYGISADDQMLMTLMQHRAVLFGLIAAACIYAAHVASARWPVLIATTISMAGFAAIAFARGQQSGPLAKIVYVDLIGIAIAALLFILLIRTK